MQNLRHMLSNESPSIYCIQEPYCTNLGFPANVPKNYNAFGVTNSRAIILAHVSIDLIFSNEFSTEDITVCFMNSSKRYIASIYLDILKDPIDCCAKFATGLKCSNRHRSKSMRVTKLFFCQIDPPMSASFWQKNRLDTQILFDLCLFEHFSPVANFAQQSIFCF